MVTYVYPSSTPTGYSIASSGASLKAVAPIAAKAPDSGTIGTTEAFTLPMAPEGTTKNLFFKKNNNNELVGIKNMAVAKTALSSLSSLYND